MDQFTLIVAMIVAAALGLLAILLILRRERIRAEKPAESPFAVSTEGEKRCPKCGMGNLWTDARCISCGSDLPG